MEEPTHFPPAAITRHEINEDRANRDAFYLAMFLCVLLAGFLVLLITLAAHSHFILMSLPEKSPAAKAQFTCGPVPYEARGVPMTYPSESDTAFDRRPSCRPAANFARVLDSTRESPVSPARARFSRRGYVTAGIFAPEITEPRHREHRVRPSSAPALCALGLGAASLRPGSVTRSKSSANV